MPKTKTFRTTGGRFLFRCHSCLSKKMVTIGHGIRRRSVRCHKCGELTRCILNRREKNRELQAGKVLVFFTDGRKLEVDLHDVSNDGVGFDVHYRDLKKIKINQQIQFRCPWNPLLLGQKSYRIKSIHNARIGAEKIG